MQPTKSIIHHVKPEDTRNLEEMFAYLTDTGWVIPEWIHLLKESNEHPTIPSTITSTTIL